MESRKGGSSWKRRGSEVDDFELKGFLVVPFVFLYSIDDVERAAAFEERKFGGDVEADPVHVSCSLTERKADMLFLDDSGSIVVDVTAEEDGLGIAGPERLHLFQNIVEGGSNGVERKGDIDVQLGEQGAGLDGRGNCFFEFPGEGFDLVRQQSNAGGGEVPAVA